MKNTDPRRRLVFLLRGSVSARLKLLQCQMHHPYQQVVQRIKYIGKPFGKVGVSAFFAVIEHGHAKICCHQCRKHNADIEYQRQGRYRTQREKIHCGVEQCQRAVGDQPCFGPFSENMQRNLRAYFFRSFVYLYPSAMKKNITGGQKRDRPVSSSNGSGSDIGNAKPFLKGYQKWL